MVVQADLDKACPEAMATGGTPHTALISGEANSRVP